MKGKSRIKQRESEQARERALKYYLDEINERKKEMRKIKDKNSPQYKRLAMEIAELYREVERILRGGLE